ncbi:MAG: hypothetical protein KA104_01365 [Candidatus Pacebacteria bacterium]|nr:hypothetical protein [Candidatus Paceibacterota bacterium]
MTDFSIEELEAALERINSLISKSEKAKVNLTQGHLTLVENRIAALRIAEALIRKALEEGN